MGEFIIFALIGAYCGYLWDRKKHRARVSHARIYDGWDNPETYPKDYGGMIVSMLFGAFFGLLVLGVFFR